MIINIKHTYIRFNHAYILQSLFLGSFLLLFLFHLLA
jgi:hypothetical protein